MYAKRIKCRSRKWGLRFQPSESLIRPIGQDHAHTKFPRHATVTENGNARGFVVKRYLFTISSSRGIAAGNNHIGLHGGSSTFLKGSQLLLFSSKGNGRNANEDKHINVNDGANFDKEKTLPEKSSANLKHSDAHAQLGEQDQKEWLDNEELAIERKKKESPYLTKRGRFKRDFRQRIVPWYKLSVSWEKFPYYIQENTRDLLAECAGSHLKHPRYAASYGGRLLSSSGRILLQSVPGTELYRERLVKALAQDLQVSLLVLDKSVLAPYDFSDGCSSDCDSDEESADPEEESTSESGVEDENDANNEEWTSSGEAKNDCCDSFDDIAATEEALKGLIPSGIEEMEKLRASGEHERLTILSKYDAADLVNSNKPLKKGDRVKYIGPSVNVEADDRPLPTGQRGEIYEVDGDRVAFLLDIHGNNDNGEMEPPVYWIQVNEVERDQDTQDWYIAIEALGEVLDTLQPIIVYFPDSSQWLSRAVPKSNRKEFVYKLHEMFNRLSAPVVLICGQNKVETGSKEKEKSKMMLPYFGHLKLPLSLKRLTEGLTSTKIPEDDKICDLFTNVFWIDPPKEDDLLRTFNKQVEEDRRVVISRSNLSKLHEVLEKNELSCSRTDLLRANTDGVILTKRKAEKVVGWAKNHYLSSCMVPHIMGNRLHLPRKSLEIAIKRLKEQETLSQKPSQNLKNLAKDEFETNFVSAVVPPGEIGVKFDDIGALEDVKKALNELVILPMRRPELFSRGNLLRPCKGILLFGPPGTGKTLLAKALATEAGANFISITGSTLTSKWFGDAEKLTKALFSFATKLAPVIIFVDEVDSLLGARGGASEHEATRRMRNEFMAAWDGLRSKDSQRILILGATNRPFDLDDAVIRRLPRRIYVDLPDAKNRIKILKIFLAEENLELDFQLDKLANATDGYSGSDLKNLCIAAAYRPVQELLEGEKGSQNDDVAPVLRPLSLEDFIQSKAKVGPSVAFDAATMNELRKWNEQYGEDGSRTKSPFGFGN